MRTPSPFGAVEMPTRNAPIVRELDRLAGAIDESHLIKNTICDRLEIVTSPSWVSNQKAPRPEPSPAVREQVCPIAQRIADLADLVERINDNYRGLTQALEI